MPEQVHLLISAPVKARRSTVLQMVKPRVPRRARLKLRTCAAAAQRSLRFNRTDPCMLQLSQPRFCDFTGGTSTFTLNASRAL
jgi:hypothetical protein